VVRALAERELASEDSGRNTLDCTVVLVYNYTRVETHATERSPNVKKTPIQKRDAAVACLIAEHDDLAELIQRRRELFALYSKYYGKPNIVFSDYIELMAAARQDLLRQITELESLTKLES
jgi:hypothetical protein